MASQTVAPAAPGATGGEPRRVFPLSPWALLLSALLLLWPAVLNRGPFLFPDTTAYVRAADGAVFKLTGHATPWTGELLASAAPHAAAAGGAPPRRAVLAGRSIYYGLFLYACGVVFGSFWPAALTQALVAMLCLVIAVRRHVPRSEAWPAWWPVALTAGLAITTPLAFFVCYMMPDLFAGLAVLAIAMLLAPGSRSSRRETGFWFAVLAAALLFHSANLLITVALLLLAPVLAWARQTRLDPWGVVAIVLALGVGLGGEAAFSAAVTKTTGTAPIRPPFVMARLIDDGPGTRFLHEACPQRPAPFHVCRYLERLPLPSDDFLWTSDPRGGVFMTVPPEEQRALSAEQSRFAVAVVAHHPLAQANATARDALYQLSLIGLGEFNYPAGMRDFFTTKLPDGLLRQQRRTLAFASRFPTAPVLWLTWAVVLASVLWLAWCAVTGARAGRSPVRLERLDPGLLVLGVLVNAAVCGGLSTPHERYEARVIWLLPLAALAAVKRSPLRVHADGDNARPFSIAGTLRGVGSRGRSNP